MFRGTGETESCICRGGQSLSLSISADRSPQGEAGVAKRSSAVLALPQPRVAARGAPGFSAPMLTGATKQRLAN
ncbi:hypothetical protein IF2G_00176 [Cordyceps javanica]|nr:hypothetical protein IF2G_00176 [Cordyceps javanica]